MRYSFPMRTWFTEADGACDQDARGYRSAERSAMQPNLSSSVSPAVEDRERAVSDGDGKMVRFAPRPDERQGRDLSRDALLERCTVAVKAAGQLLYDWDPVTNHVTYDGEVELITGYKEDELEGDLSRLIDLVHPDDRPEFLRETERVKATGTSFDLGFRLVRKNGAVIFVDDRGEFVRNEEGEITRMIGVVFDVTARARQETLFREANETGGIGLWSWDLMTGEVTADRLARDLWGVGFEPDLRLGRLLAQVHPADAARARDVMERTVAAREAYALEFRVVRPDATVRRLAVRGNGGSKLLGPEVVTGIVIDVTAQRLGEVAVQESERRFKALAETLPQMVWSTGPDGFHDYYNRRWYEFTGVPEGARDKEEWDGIFHPDDRDRAWERWRHSLATGSLYEVEYRLRHRSGEYRWTLARALPVRDEQGIIERWFGTCTDIHDLKQAEQARELLSRELTHRIKNIFAVVMSLIGLTARAHPAATSFATELRERLAGLARAHDYIQAPSRSLPDAADPPRELRGLLLGCWRRTEVLTGSGSPSRAGTSLLAPTRQPHSRSFSMSSRPTLSSTARLGYPKAGCGSLARRIAQRSR